MVRFRHVEVRSAMLEQSETRGHTHSGCGVSEKRRWFIPGGERDWGAGAGEGLCRWHEELLGCWEDGDLRNSPWVSAFKDRGTGGRGQVTPGH